MRESTCWTCFEDFFSKRFRSHALKARKDRRELFQIDIAFSGGLASCVLLDLVGEWINRRPGGQRNLLDVGVVHIDESALLPLTPAEHAAKQQLIDELVVQRHHLPLTVLRLEDVFEDEEPQTRVQKLQQLFAAASTQTTKEDLLPHLRRLLFIRSQRQRGRPTLLLATTATNLAVQLISSSSKGRGFVLPNELGYVEAIKQDDGPEVTFAQPLKEFLDREIYFYSHKKRLNYFPSLPYTLVLAKSGLKGVGPKSSINILTYNFITGLQRDFNHTVHTLLGSADKLYVNEGELKDADTAPVHYQYCGLCAHLLSREERKTKSEGPVLCYSCRVLAAENTQKGLVQQYAQHSAQTLNGRLKQEIQEFLLEDNNS
jgi:cytoplasmic tRNA 2-thiolation protein 2